MVIRVTTEDVQQKKFDLTAYTEGKDRVRVQRGNRQYRAHQYLCKRT